MSRIASLSAGISKITVGALFQLCFMWVRKCRALLLLPALLASYPAASQTPASPTGALPPPPERITLDQNHVDVMSGAISLSFNELSIGSGASGLQLVSTYNSGSGWRDNLVGVLQMRTFGEWNGDVEITASWANQAWTFNSLQGYSRGGDGADLESNVSGDFVVTLRDGTVMTYSRLAEAGEVPCPGDGTIDCYAFYFATSIVYPNGLTVTPHYRVYLGSGGMWAIRIQSVTNNAGYQIKFNYQSNTVSNNSRGPFLTRTSAVALNNAVEYCDPDADTCSLSGNWPTATYSGSGDSYTRTDALGRTTQFTSTATSFRVRTPGSNADNLQYTIALFNVGGGTVWRVTSATLGSATWSYGYVVDYQPNSNRPLKLTVTSTDPLTRQTVYVSSSFWFPTNFFGEWSSWGLTSVKDPLNRTTTFSYPCVGSGASVYFNGGSYKVTSPEQNAATPACDPRGNLTSTTLQPKPGSGLANIIKSSVFSNDCPNSKTCNQPSAVIDGRQAQTDYTYYPTHGGLWTETLPAVPICSMDGMQCPLVRPKKTYEYEQYYAYVRNAAGALVQAAGSIWMPTKIRECRTTSSCVGQADETVTTFQYGAQGTVNRLLLRGKVVASNGISLRTCYGYDNFGNRISATTARAVLSSCPDSAPASAAAFTTSYRYDAGRQNVGTISAATVGGFEAARITYDAEGHVKKVESGYLAQWQLEATPPTNWPNFTILEVTDKTYDVLGRLLTDKRSSGSGADPVLTQHSYDSVGQLECSAVRMNSAAYGALPTSACVLTAASVGGPDRITHLLYDSANQVTTEQRAYGTSLQQNYATYFYTPNGRLDWVEDAMGNRSDFTYDGFDRVTRLNFPSTTVGAHAANGGDYEGYGYDENSNRTSLRLRSGETIYYQYDDLNRLKLKDLPAGNDIVYRYDLPGHNRLARFGSTTGFGVASDFDGFGRMIYSTSASASGSLQLGYQSDENGNRTRVTWPDGHYVQYTYDSLDRMDQVRENGQTSGQGLLADYSYNMLSWRSNLVRGNGTTTTYYPDGISRLDHMVQDLASTPGDVTLGFVYNKANQVTQRTVSNDSYSYFSLPHSRSYTPNGLNRYDNVAGVTYGYDGRGNLTSDGSRGFSYDYENRLLSVSGASSLSLEYDPLGRLLTTSSSGKTTRYLFDGDRLVAEYDGSTLVRRYVHGAGVDEPLVWYEGTNLTDRRWLHTDHQGSVIATSDGTGSGTPYAYSAYGEPAYDNWGGSRFRFTGQIMLAEAKLYHYKARVYDPQLGRFLQTDPVGYTDDFNLYAYVGNDPLNRTDPLGTYSCGASLSSGQCDTFSQAQEAAKTQITSAVKTLSGIQSKVAAGEKLSGSEQKAADAVSKVLGKGAGTDAKVLGNLIGTASKMLAQLAGNTPAEGGTGSAYATAEQRKLTLNSSFFASSNRQQIQTVGHESVHHGVGLGETPDNPTGLGRDGPVLVPYGRTNIGRIADYLQSPSSMLRKADAVSFALGFERDDGYQ